MKQIQFINLCLLILSCLFFAQCKKDNAKEYQGVVSHQSEGCTNAKGIPFVVMYTKDNNLEDSFTTVSLPTSFQIPGTKISFKINDKVPPNEAIVCNAMVLMLIQKSIYDIKSQ